MELYRIFVLSFIYSFLLTPIDSVSQVVYTQSFDNDTADWITSNGAGTHDWRLYGDVGVGDGGGLRCKLTPDGNHLMTPAVSLLADSTYTIYSAVKKAKSNTPRYLQLSINDEQSLDVILQLLDRIIYLLLSIISLRMK